MIFWSMRRAAIVVRLRETRWYAADGSASARRGSGPRRACIACFSSSVIRAQVVGPRRSTYDVAFARRRRTVSVGGGAGASPKFTLPKRPRWMWIQSAVRKARKRCLPWASACSRGVPSRRVAASVNLPWGLVTRVGPPANLAA
jgi:hypothetical protein